jgi:hypothetical protein
MSQTNQTSTILKHIDDIINLAHACGEYQIISYIMQAAREAVLLADTPQERSLVFELIQSKLIPNL